MSTKRFVYSMLGVSVLLVATAGPAAAHVTVQPGEATKGGFTKIAFRVPNESDTAGTVRLEVAFPTDTPIASVRTRPMAGWTAQRRTEQLATPVQSGEAQITEAVRTVTWTAEPGVRIGPGEFTEFELSLGRLPDNVDRLVLPAVQTYDDGSVVRWDEAPPADGGAEPEHLAPVLRLVDAEQDGPAAAAPAPTGTNAAAPNQTAPNQTAPNQTAPNSAEPNAAEPNAGQDDTARLLGALGLLAGALALGLAIGAIVAGRRRARPQ